MMAWIIRAATIACAWALVVSAPASLGAQEATGVPAGSAPDAIELPRIPRIQLQPIPGYGPAPLVVGFMVTSVGPPVEFRSFRWELGDGQVSNLPPTALFHTYAKPGSYVVTVTVTTAGGHTASAFGGVIVTPPSH